MIRITDAQGCMGTIQGTIACSGLGCTTGNVCDNNCQCVPDTCGECQVWNGSTCDNVTGYSSAVSPESGFFCCDGVKIDLASDICCNKQIYDKNQFGCCPS